MKLVKNYKPKKGGFAPKYPWDKWLAAIRQDTSLPEGRGYKLTRGIDFYCQKEALDNNIRKRAKRAGFRVSIFREKDGLMVFFAGML